MVEEDVLVTPDFFEWHYDVQDRKRPFVSVGASRLSDDENSYRSLGACFELEYMQKVAAHAVPKYFANMLAYCSRLFPNSGVPIQQTEQDGLIRRIMETNDKWMPVFPDTPVAYHDATNQSAADRLRELGATLACRFVDDRSYLRLRKRGRARR